jgi:hypothetical protein
MLVVGDEQSVRSQNYIRRVDYFDVEPLLPRGVRRLVGLGIVAGLLIIPGPTSRLIEGQLQLRATEIAQPLEQIVRHSFRDALTTHRGSVEPPGHASRGEARRGAANLMDPIPLRQRL